MNDSNKDQQLLELYKLHAELADRVSQRREGANRLYVSILTGFFVTIVVPARIGAKLIFADPWFFTVSGLLGMALSSSWYVVIRSYRQLNSGKFAALDELEDKLEYPFFQREWKILKKGENFRNYWKLTVVETSLPMIFGLVYLAMAIYGMLPLLYALFSSL
ncbi:MAG: hypothetical protein M2R45_03185 [Verrucomicrobia subdivision 3 bacterium]|nr:hypothetical protein [Limisphaerales bacterium]MCS1417740.1 hypothetical protein [Limisphaerales bacterium]